MSHTTFLTACIKIRTAKPEDFKEKTPSGWKFALHKVFFLQSKTGEIIGPYQTGVINDAEFIKQKLDEKNIFVQV